MSTGDSGTNKRIQEALVLLGAKWGEYLLPVVKRRMKELREAEAKIKSLETENQRVNGLLEYERSLRKQQAKDFEVLYLEQRGRAIKAAAVLTELEKMSKAETLGTEYEHQKELMEVWCNDFTPCLTHRLEFARAVVEKKLAEKNGK